MAKGAKVQRRNRKTQRIIIVLILLVVIGTASQSNKTRNSSSKNDNDMVQNQEPEKDTDIYRETPVTNHSTEYVETAFSEKNSEIGQKIDEQDKNTTNESPEKERSTEQSSIFYPDNKAINAFIIAFNKAYPEMAIQKEDIEPYYHHGSTHLNQVQTHIDNLYVTISEEYHRSPFGVSVFYSAYQDDFDNVEANQKLFGYCLHVSNPELSEEDIETRWNDVLTDLTNSPEWDDGIKFQPGSKPLDDMAGAFEYFKLYL